MKFSALPQLVFAILSDELICEVCIDSRTANYTTAVVISVHLIMKSS